MESKTPIKCRSCGTSEKVKEVGDFEMCEACEEATIKQLKEWKDSRTQIYPEIDHICDHIYLGNEDASMSKDLLVSKGIKRILVCGNYLEKHFPDLFEYHKISIDDAHRQNLFPYFLECFEFMAKPGSIFVHCAAGVSRSASIVIGYLIYSKNMKYVDAKELVKKQRSIIMPNMSFRWQLQKLSDIAASESPDWSQLQKLRLEDLNPDDA